MGWSRIAPIVIAFPLASCRTAGPVRRTLTPEQKALGAKALSLLQDGMQSGEENIRSAAALAWGRLGNPAAKGVCIAALGDASEDVRLAAAYSLWRLGDETGVSVVRSLASKQPLPQDVDPFFKTRAEYRARLRARAVRTYSQMLGPAAIPFLRTLASDPDPIVSEAAVVAMTKLGEPQRGALEAILSTALTGDRIKRARAIRLLGEMHNPDVLDALKHLASMKDREIQAQALEALGEQESVLALPEIVSGLADGDDKVRLSAARALAKVRDKAATPSLKALLAEPLPLNLYGWMGLKRLDQEAPSSIPAEAAQAPEASVRIEAAEALELDGAEALGPLKALLEDSDAQVRVRAALSTLLVLGRLG